MSLDWQNIVSWGIVALAIGYLAHVGWQTVIRKRATACGGGCKSCAASGEPEVVTIVATPAAANGQAHPTRSAAGMAGPASPCAGK